MLPVKITRIIYGLLIAAAVVIPLVLFSSGFFAAVSKRVLPGIEVMGISLEGLNKAEGLARLAELEKELRATRVLLRYQEDSWPLLLNEVGFNLNEEEIMEAALSAGRSGPLLQRWQERKRFKKTGLSLKPVIEFDREKLAGRVNELAAKIIVKPRDASFQINSDDTVTIIPGSNGIGVDLGKLEEDIINVLSEGKKREVNLSLTTVPPARSTELLESMGVKGLLASYTTSFDPSKTSRTYNISVAAKAFDELLIRPGHEVSFNKVVGPRSSEAGYKTAPIIVNNEFVDGLGGGVCQVSTTLYNCVLLANLDIIERSNHSIPVSYVPIGRDATVVYDAIDFKFRNNTGDYLYVKSYVSNGHITFKMYGNTAYKRDVSVNTWIVKEIEPKTVYETDPNLPKGEQVVKQEGSKGFIVAAERVVRKNGVVEKREMLPSSDYSPVNKIIAVGVMERAVPQIAPSTPAPSPVRLNEQVSGSQGNAAVTGPAGPGGSDGDQAPASGSGSPAVMVIPGSKPPAGGGDAGGSRAPGGWSAPPERNGASP
ncbi:Uncharacterized vancomycin resistance protein [Pelotomaculum thermopropionicum SI]|uniref:Uncharacterized vancomycin resistance protein n=1 Tax=Pelotomaculum thermopropionicum (strain DSM 13744 / JCM 10971 / SI) TaxID=370438 RepID=A5D3C5_PELTS|nr:Uncharacterized vancomycin resistance protein [Pelotomaculum thermopropionicum SI]